MPLLAMKSKFDITLAAILVAILSLSIVIGAHTTEIAKLQPFKESAYLEYVGKGRVETFCTVALEYVTVFAEYTDTVYIMRLTPTRVSYYSNIVGDKGVILTYEAFLEDNNVPCYITIDVRRTFYNKTTFSVSVSFEEGFKPRRVYFEFMLEGRYTYAYLPGIIDATIQEAVNTHPEWVETRVHIQKQAEKNFLLLKPNTGPCIVTSFAQHTTEFSVRVYETYYSRPCIWLNTVYVNGSYKAYFAVTPLYSTDLTRQELITASEDLAVESLTQIDYVITKLKLGRGIVILKVRTDINTVKNVYNMDPFNTPPHDLNMNLVKNSSLVAVYIPGGWTLQNVEPEAVGIPFRNSIIGSRGDDPTGGGFYILRGAGNQLELTLTTSMRPTAYVKTSEVVAALAVVYIGVIVVWRMRKPLR